ncbi:TPA: hypothetical protein QDZ08_003552, partial [Pseudomonas putida]|nr:hypothetical protein [Pseudomonas putida]
MVKRIFTATAFPRTAGFMLTTLAASLCSAAANADQAFAIDSRWMTGDWGGLRTELLEQGINIKLGYVGESASGLRGGYDRHN